MARGKAHEWLARNRGGLAIGVLGMLAVGLAAFFLQRPTQPSVVVQAPTPRPSPSPVVVPIAVHVSGEVAQPGLYRLPPGARIDDAVTSAGGPTADADVQRLNLAARLADGQQVTVPRKVDVLPAGNAAGPAGSSLVNLNVASVADLDTLPGIGPAIAQRIVAYREQNGPFSRVDQLLEAKLVNAPTFERIKGLVTVCPRCWPRSPGLSGLASVSSSGLLACGRAPLLG